MIFLFYSSFCDIREREVSDKVWISSIPVCLALSLFGVYTGDVNVLDLIVSTTSAFIIGFILFYFGFFGGADVKALLLISLAFPSYPHSYKGSVGIIIPIPFYLTFINSMILSASYPITILILNIVDLLRGKSLLEGINEKGFLKKCLLFIICRKISFEELKEKNLKYFPAEQAVESDGKVERKPIYFIRAEADIDEIISGMEKHRDLYAHGVLVSPTLPMITFLTAGLISSYVIVLAQI